MRSLSAALSLACLCVLVICLFLAHAISLQTEHVYIEPVFQRMDRMELRDARTAVEDGGLPALRSYLTRLDRQFGGNHHLLDADGRDVDGGADRTIDLPPAPLTRSRGTRNGLFTLAQRSDDGRYWFVANQLVPSSNVSFLPFYLLMVGVVVALGALVTAYLVLPLRSMAAVVQSFGVGTMSARIKTTRKDEIGALANSYDDMADRLEGAFERERQLLQDLSHELRAPLARLSFSTNLARTAKNRDAALDDVKRDLDRLAFLVSELTAWSIGPLGGDFGAEATLVDLETIVLDAVHDCELEASSKGCLVACTGFAHELILGDREHLRRAIDNVLRNAVLYSPSEAAIEVVLHQTDDRSSITVRDFGPGVPEDLLQRVFDPFFQVNTARSASQKGLGLGLSIARRSVEKHCGTITAENAHPGLIVRIILPHEDQGQVNAQQSYTSLQPSQSLSKSIR